MIVTALLAAAAMVASCVLSVISVQAEAAGKGSLAGLSSAFGFLASYAYTKAALDASGLAEVVTLAVVFVAVIVGTKLGAYLGRRLLHLRVARRYGLKVNRLDVAFARQLARYARHPRKGIM